MAKASRAAKAAVDAGVLEKIIGSVTAKHGPDALRRVGDRPRKKYQVIPTGSTGLDMAVGVGGLPRGRIHEIYGESQTGKTTLVLHLAAEAQAAGTSVAFIDAEHALDLDYAAKLGVDVDNLLLCQPDSGEQALNVCAEICEAAAEQEGKNGVPGLVIVDSVAALVPEKELEGDNEDPGMGLQARMMGKGIRKIVSAAAKGNVCVVFINQVRMKIGVVFGCFSYGTRVTLADGSQEKIGKIVNQRLPVEALALNQETGVVESRRVTNWFNNGHTDSFLKFTVARPAGNGRSRFKCTPNHRIHTPNGWVEAQQLAAGDLVLQAHDSYLSPAQLEVIRGGLLGDTALSSASGGLSARLRFGHCAQQAEYAAWKASLFDNVGYSRTTGSDAAVFYDLPALVELAELRRSVYANGQRKAHEVLSDDYLTQMSALSLAIWYMDDAGFTLRSEGKQVRTQGGSGRVVIGVQALHEESRARLVTWLGQWGLSPRLKITGKKRLARLVFDRSDTDRLQSIVAPYIHPSMDYKLLPRYRGAFRGVDPQWSAPVKRVWAMPVLEVKTVAAGKNPYRYDLEVEGAHNYFVDGVNVHNSPETTTGGKALAFFSTIRLRTGSAGWIDKAGDREGRRVNVRVEKNKVATPFRMVEYDIMFGAGIDHAGEVIDHGVARGVITVAGTRLSFNGKEIANGRPNSKLKLSEDTALADAIEAAILKHHETHGLVLPGKSASGGKGKKGAKDEPTTPHDPETGEVTE